MYITAPPPGDNLGGQVPPLLPRFRRHCLLYNIATVCVSVPSDQDLFDGARPIKPEKEEEGDDAERNRILQTALKMPLPDNVEVRIVFHCLRVLSKESMKRLPF